MPHEVLLFICGVGVLQAALLAALIYYHPNSDKSVNVFLALYIFCLCIPMCSPVIQHYFAWQILILIDPFPLLSGPLLYFYVRSFKEEMTWRKVWPHLVLFAIYVGLDISLFTEFASTYDFNSTVPVEVVHHPSSILRVSGRIIQMIVYFFLASRQLSIYQRSIAQLFSDTTLINLSWVRWLVNGYLFLVLLMAGLYLMILRFPENFQWFILVNTALVTPYLYLFTFKGITQPTLWQIRQSDKHKVEEEFHLVEELEKKEELTPNAPSEKNEEIVRKVIAAMESERLYLQPDLTLQELSDSLQVQSYLVSQAINEGLNKNFYDLVNGYRVEEARRRLGDISHRNAKIIAVAFESGFNSKTTFNTVFKKFTGVTPSEFRQQAS